MILKEGSFGSIKQGPESKQKRKPERDITVSIIIPSQIRDEILSYISGNWSNWDKDLRQHDYEVRVDQARAEKELPPLNPSRKYRDRDIMVANFNRYNDILQRYRDSLSSKTDKMVVPEDLIKFLDWRLGHKKQHVQQAQEKGNKRDEEKNQKEVDQLKGWIKTILEQCPIIEEQNQQ